MSAYCSSRRGFLKTAALAAAGAGVGIPHLEGAPVPPATRNDGVSEPLFPGWSEVFAAPACEFFGVRIEERQESFGNGKTGVRRKRVPRDAATYYLAGGISGEEEPHSFGLSFEITNNNLLCSATSNGILLNPLVYSRNVAAYRRGASFMAAELLGGSAWSFGLRCKGEQPVRLPMTHYSTVELVDGLYPRFGFQVKGLAIQQLVFAPDLGGAAQDNPRALIVVLQMHNGNGALWRGSVIAPNLQDGDETPSFRWLATPVESPHPRFTEHPVPIGAGYEAILNFDHEGWTPRCPLINVEMNPGETKHLSFALLLGSSIEQVQATARQVRRFLPLDWLNLTWKANRTRYGALSIQDGNYYAALFRRMVETDRSAILFSDTGECFTGGPSGATFILSAFQPQVPAHDLDGIRAFKPRPAGTPAPDVSWSLVNTLYGLAFTGIHYRLSGDSEGLRGNSGLIAYAQETLSDVLATRQGEPYLFPSKMLWDGPSPGDYNTGANIVAWLAFDGMGRIASEVFDRRDLGESWRSAAERIRKDIYRCCIGPSALGPRFYEGAFKEGTFAPGHNGEEAFTTMAPFFGFCEADEPALIRHAKLAFTKENPLYESSVNGIWWDSNTFGNGTTMPGQMALLAGIENEPELLKNLEQLRQLVDLDGALWWWPYRYPCADPRVVERRGQPADVSKCGYAASVFAAVFLTNVLGVFTDAPAKQVRFSPFVPWPDFEWKEMRLGAACFSLHYERREREMMAKLVNLNGSEYQATLELTLPPGAAIGGAGTNGFAGLEIRPATRFGRPSMRASGKVAPGTAAELNLRFA